MCFSSSFAALTDIDVWSVASSRPVKSGESSTTGSATGQYTRLAEVAPFDIVAVRLIYANWQNASGSSEFPNYNAIRVRCAVHRAGTAAPDRATTDPIYPGSFGGGRDVGIVPAGGVLFSDPIQVAVAEGERYWVDSYGDPALPAGPAAPTLALAAAAGLTIATHCVQVSYVWADGSESAPSAETSILTTSGNQQITVTTPAAAAGAVGYRIYIGLTAGGIKGENQAVGMRPIGTDTTLSGIPTTTALSRIVRLVSNNGLPLGRGLLAGNGDWNVSGRDNTREPVAGTGSASYASQFGPIGLIAIAADGRRHRSVAITGDSIMAGTGDRGYGGALGGPVFRACANQTAAIAYDLTKTTSIGFLQLAQGGETLATWLTAVGGAKRRAVAELATTVVSNYGTNDIGSGSATVVRDMVAELALWSSHKRFFKITLDPKTTSTDGWKTVANQAFTSNQSEADRRACNNFIASITGAVAVTAEAMFRNGSSPFTSASTITGGDGRATRFLTAHPFRTGTETIRVNGATQAVTTNYTYYGTATIDGNTYASGVTFGAAPGNGLSVTADYTKVAGLQSRSGVTGVLDLASAVEVNAAGTAGTNGGFWAPPTGGTTTGTATASASTLLTQTGAGWTVDAFRGWVVRITADAGTPAAVGLVNDIQSNTATALTLGTAWSTTPSATASFEIYRSLCVDGIHNASEGARRKALLVDTTLL